MKPLHIAVPPRANLLGSDLETGYQRAAGDLSTHGGNPAGNPATHRSSAWAGSFASLPCGSFAKIDVFFFVARSALSRDPIERYAIVIQAPRSVNGEMTKGC
jgi:hypothetical protein